MNKMRPKMAMKNTHTKKCNYKENEIKFKYTDSKSNVQI